MRVSFQEMGRKVDWWMISAVLGLSGVGLLVLRSLTWPEDDRFLRQGLFLVIGLLVFIGVQFLDIHFWRNASLIVYLAILILLIGLILFGDSTRGARGWIMVGSFGIQPAEFAKIAVILFLATTLERLQFDLAKVGHVALALGIIGLPFALTALQPDLGSGFIILAAGLIMVLYTGLDKKKLFVLAGLGILAICIAWFGVLRPYQKNRILTFLNPQSDPLGSGYNVTQSIVAVGSGGMFGRGLGLGPQSQLNFLPEQETDFIFASLAEELGFIGSMLVLILFGFFFFRLLRVLGSGTHAFENFLVLGIISMFLVQSGVNIAMNMGMFPITGVTLPFISYGGSSLVASFWALGIVMTARP